MVKNQSSSRRKPGSISNLFQMEFVGENSAYGDDARWIPAFAGMTPRGEDGTKMGGYVYINANRKNGALYIGVTNDLARRAYEHREGITKGHTSRYGITKLVYYEQYDRIEDAIAREKQVKVWKRDWKIELIESMNSDWRDLYFDLNK